MNSKNDLPRRLPDGLDWHESGYAAVSGALADFTAQLDGEFREWAAALNAWEHHFPSLIALKDLKPIGYLRSFPHLATFAVSLRDDKTILKSFADSHATAECVDAAEDYAATGHILTPAACYHFYYRLAGQRLDVDLYLTTRCLCHRREERYSPLERQWCFNMRELVCIGTSAAVDAFVDNCVDRIEGLKSRLGITARWQTATDPFFDPLGDPKALAQQLEPVKQELVLTDELAIASVNRHRCFFGECYDIRRGDQAADSACVAFGMERWLLALTRAHGHEPERWPVPREKSG